MAPITAEGETKMTIEKFEEWLEQQQKKMCEKLEWCRLNTPDEKDLIHTIEGEIFAYAKAIAKIQI